jgi:hypothetical protein
MRRCWARASRWSRKLDAMAQVNLPDLAGTQWVHSHEEDGPDTTVFRPPSHAFPPSRGRKRMTFAGGGKMEGSIPGPVDAPSGVAGKWTLAGDRLTVSYGKTSLRYRVIAAEKDKLTLRREDD